MAGKKSTPKDLPDAVRDAVERTVQATAGSAERSRSRAQGALDDIADRVKGGLPATNEDIRNIKAELRRISRRLDSIEERLPARRQKRSS